jgi:hypothetical protein
MGSDGNLFALELDSGLERWRVKLGDLSGALPAVSDGNVFAGSYEKTFYMIDAVTGEQRWTTSGVFSLVSTVVTDKTVYVANSCGYLYLIDREAVSRRSYQIDKDKECSAISSPIVSGGRIFLTTRSGAVVGLGDIRTTVAIEAGMIVESSEDTVLRAAPSTGAVVRGELPLGTQFQVTGGAEDRDGQRWWPAEVEGVGTGWVIERTLVAAEVPPTPISTSTPQPTATPGLAMAEADALATAEAELEAVPTPAELGIEAERYSAHLHTGGCGDLGPPRERLADLVQLRNGVPDRQLAVAAATTEVAMTLPDIIGGNHTISVANPTDPSVSVACGAIAGTVDEQGDLFNALSPMNGSRAAGVAWFRSNGPSTTIVVFFAPGVAASGMPEGAAERPLIMTVIAEGNCDAVEGQVERLADVAPSRSADGSARPVTVSTTRISVPLQELDGQLVVGYEAQDLENPVFCGRVEGEPDEHGDLFLAVPAYGDGQTFGFAWLHDNMTSTTVVLLVA